jgi:hypothetical protein
MSIRSSARQPLYVFRMLLEGCGKQRAPCCKRQQVREQAGIRIQALRDTWVRCRQVLIKQASMLWIW